jgi:hypothetical protein
MTPKEKAKELFDKMYMVDDPMGNYPMCFDTAKQCALIAIDEVIDNIEDDYMHYELDWWQEVKQEINKL